MKKLFLLLICFVSAMSIWADGTELWTSSTITSVDSWFANTSWTQETESTATLADGKVTVSIAVDKNAQWQGQVKLNTNLATLSADKQYDFSFKINSTKAVGGVTVKMFDNNQIFYSTTESVAAGETKTITYKDYYGNASAHNGVVVFDFGYAAAGTDVVLSDFSLIEHEQTSAFPDLSAEAAGSYASSGTASLGNDGNTGTRWESTFNDNQWWAVNYGEQHSFNTMKFIWEGAYAKSFEIYGSNDGKTWGDPIKTVTDQSLSGFPYTQIIDLGTTYSYQYLLFKGVARATQYGYSFYEFDAYVAESSVLTTFTATPASAICKIGESDAITVQALDQYGAAMDVTADYTVSPADAGTVAEGKYTPAKAGNATITATSGEKTSSFTVFAYAGENVALSTNLTTDNKIVAQSNSDNEAYASGNSFDAFFAVDTNDDSVWQGCINNTTTDAEADRTYDSWFVVDLGKNYDIEIVTIKFEGANSQDYTVQYSADNTEWRTAYTYAGTNGIYGHTDYLYAGTTQKYVTDENAVATGVRYVKFYSTKAATQYGMKIYAFKVFGVESTSSSISSVNAVENTNKAIYNVNGQRLSQPVKGLNIINGKAVIVK